jgi:hypothetical protein
MKRISFVLLFLLISFYFMSCNKVDSDTLPIVTTIVPIDITETTIQMGGIIISTCNLKIMEYGACWDSLPDPSISDSKIILVPEISCGDTLEFEAIITGLISKTDYYVRAYAINCVGTAYGESLLICTCK